MGQGDVKMQTGFGAWVAALYGSHEGLWTIVYAVCAGYIIGGILGLAMMMLRGQLHRNLGNVREIFRDLQVMVTMGPGAAHQRAHQRRATWHRLPYGIPLCIGFVGTLIYLHWIHKLSLASLPPAQSAGGTVRAISGLSPLPGTTRFPGIRRISRKSLKVRRPQSRRNPPEVGLQ